MVPVVLTAKAVKTMTVTPALAMAMTATAQQNTPGWSKGLKGLQGRVVHSWCGSGGFDSRGGYGDGGGYNGDRVNGESGGNNVNGCGGYG